MADDQQPADDDKQPEDDSGALSQADVDAILGGTGGPSDPPGEAAEPGALSQEMIDAMLVGDNDAADEAGDDAAGAEAIDEGGAATKETERSTLLDDALLDRLLADSPDDDEADPSAPGGQRELGEENLFGDKKKTRFETASKHLAAPAPIREGRSETVRELDLLAEVVLTVSAEIGRSDMTIEDVLKLGPGSLIELDKLAGEPVELLVNDRCIARGEVVVVDDSFGVRITELGE